MKFHLTKKSSNSKTGPIPVSTSPEATCPTRCPLKDAGCYADGGPLAIHWKKVSSGERGLEYDDFVDEIRKLPAYQLWRHNQAGDLVPCKRDTTRIDKTSVMKLVGANEGKRGFTYTHYEVLKPGYTSDWNRDIIKRANQEGFTINLSADSIPEAERLHDLGIGPVTTTLPSDVKVKNFISPKGKKITVCPAAINDNISCDKCKLCAAPKRNVIIGFPSHGMRKGLVDRMFSIMEEINEDRESLHV